MVEDDLDLANSALMKVGGRIISSLSDGSNEADWCRIRLPKCINIVLRAHPWNCAISRVILAPDTATPAFGYDQQFTLPSSCLRVLWVGPDGIDRRLEGRKLLSDTTELWLKFIDGDTNVTLYDDLLAETISFRLAADLAYKITQDDGLQRNMYDMYKDQLRQAKSTDAKEDPTMELRADLWIEARQGGDVNFSRAHNSG